MVSKPTTPRRVCFVTGTRAEFGLMRSVLVALRDHPSITLQLIVTGMHLDRRHGQTIDDIRAQGWPIDAVVPWNANRSRAQSTGLATANLVAEFDRLRTDIVLVVGDRVEAFAAATAGHLSGRIVAHIHGGDRALGQVDDALRHAITKLAHVHFPATKESGQRITKLGEDRWRIHVVGSPGIEGIRQAAAPAADVRRLTGVPARRFALLVLHPVDADERVEHTRATGVLGGVSVAGFDRVVVICPNNDPGSAGIIRCWEQQATSSRYILRRDVPRPIFLGLLRDAAVLVGNSSSGIIEAASFGTPVIDLGPRQRGRERCENVRHVPYGKAAVYRAAAAVWNGGRPKRCRSLNIYGGGKTGLKIARILSKLNIDERLRHKLIAY
jgi:UDP-hydrolysing UDP-N-acetyl-D-glucosamine 2-epimerase